MCGLRVDALLTFFLSNIHVNVLCPSLAFPCECAASRAKNRRGKEDDHHGPDGGDSTTFTYIVFSRIYPGRYIRFLEEEPEGRLCHGLDKKLWTLPKKFM